MSGPVSIPLNHGVVSVNGADVAYSRAGDEGSAVILVHGGASNRADWAKNFPVLAAEHQVYAPDLIGFGESSRLNRTYTIGDFADFVRGFMDAMGIDKTALVGHSLGGRTCLEIARQEPERVTRAVLIAPMGFGRLSLSGFVLGTTAWAILKAIRKPLPYPPMDIQLEEPDVEGFRKIDAPSLVLWGRWDPYFPPKCGRRAVDTLPNSQLRLFYRSGHSPHRAEPSAFNKVTLDFLSS